MKQTVQVWEVDRKQVSVDVEFPVYRKHDLMLDECNSIIYTRWDQDGIEWSVQCTQYGETIEWEISKRTRAFTSSHDNADYVLGRREYASTSDEFKLAVSQAALFCGQIFNT